MLGNAPHTGNDTCHMNRHNWKSQLERQRLEFINYSKLSIFECGLRGSKSTSSQSSTSSLIDTLIIDPQHPLVNGFRVKKSNQFVPRSSPTSSIIETLLID